MGRINKIQVIGINVCGEPLSDGKRRCITDADVVVGGLRHLDLVPFFQGKRIRITADIQSVLTEIGNCLSENFRIVVLATGDPLLFGIGNTLIDHFGMDAVAIQPGISAVQAALSKLGLKTHHTVILSRHGARDDDFRKLLHHSIGVILTSHGPSVSEVMGEIMEAYPQAGQWQGHVCQCLGMAAEAIESGPMEELCTLQNLRSPNLLVLENPRPISPINSPADFGRSDDVYVHDEGMITHPEVRAITLSKLNLGAAGIVWDVGAGSGSVGIEAALLNPYATVFAIEKNVERYKNILKNKEKQGVQNLFPVHGDALAVCRTLPFPNSVFIGGGGRSLKDLLALCYERLLVDGIMVINTIAIESFEVAHRFSKGIKKEVCCVTVQVSRMRPLARYHALKPENPITIFEIRK